MAETVLSMARSMLGGAISKAASAAANEMSLLMGVRKDIWFIKDELATMQAFLVAAEGMKKKDMLLKVWAEQVRELSYNIEDCLGEFMVHVASQSLSRKLMKLKHQHQIAVQIRDLKSRVEEVSNRNRRYNLIEKNQITRTIDERDSCMEDIRNHSDSNIDEAGLVGFSKPKQEFIKLIDVHAKNGPAQVVCVVGMGGLGKTTLTRKVYESMENFYCCAWIIVSQSFVRMELLKVMIKFFFGNEALKKQLEGNVVREEDLANYLRKELLEKRYFVVLDDLWNIDDWNWIKKIALLSRNQKGSRIIITTRDVGLAKKCSLKSSVPLIYHHQPLETNDAIHLLLRKTRRSEEDMKNDVKMRETVTKIVKKSGLLPLAILTIGGMLATREVSEWQSIYDQIPLELESGRSLDAMRRMVTLSYNHLPSHLKSCFLYLSIFPEDFEIQRRRLVERWIAEGFVIVRDGLSGEEVGNSYFNDLINQSMIQPSRVNIEGVVKSCRVHDIVRDVMISVSRDENFVYVEGNNVTGATEETFRHVAYHGSMCQKIDMDWSHVRSVTVFGERSLRPSPSVCSPDMRMLRALDLENAQFQVTQKDISNIGLFRHLKYLNFSDPRGYSHIYKLPRSIGRLQGLQTLNIRDSYITELPIEICKLKSLHSLCCTRNNSYQCFDLVYDPKACLVRTLCLPMLFTPLVDPSERTKVVAELHMAWASRRSESEGVRVPKGIGKLKELQILEVVDISRTSGKAIKELGELVQLRKLSVVTEGATKQKCKVLCDAIQKLTCLRSLEVDGSLEWLHAVSSPPPLLRSLKLDGPLGEIPDWFANMMHLVKLYLEGSIIKEECKIMEILGPLPNLMQICLGNDSYIGEKLVFKTGTLPNLKKLDIYGLKQLRELIFEEGTSPELEKIEISGCTLESGIIGVNQLPKLKEISLGSYGRVAKLAMLQSEVDAHPNSPVLRLQMPKRYHDVESAAAGELSRSQAVAMVTTNVNQDDLLYNYNSC
ncbi:disease resistance protein RPM1-like isoform X2 [Triticum urartu]|nr:disease resistance protein RPM1-like isoform X2 [Triticum urartu]XP_048544851.1 disease resistance protein RPM1-like isoform X2 [Triticum urartu]